MPKRRTIGSNRSSSNFRRQIGSKIQRRRFVKGGGPRLKIHVGGIYLLPPILIFTIGDTTLEMIGGKNHDFVIWTDLKPRHADSSTCPSWSFALSNGISQLWLCNEPGKSRHKLPATLYLIIRQAVSLRIDLSADDARSLHDQFLGGKVFNDFVGKRVKLGQQSTVTFNPWSLQAQPPEMAEWSQCEATERTITFVQ